MYIGCINFKLSTFFAGYTVCMDLASRIGVLCLRFDANLSICINLSVIRS
jgi:hypothetical protein